MLTVLIVGTTGATNLKEEILVLKEPLSLEEFESLLQVKNQKITSDYVNATIKEIIYENWEIRWWITLKEGLSPEETINDIKTRLEMSKINQLQLWEDKDVWESLKDLVRNTNVNQMKIVEIIIDTNSNNIFKEYLKENISSIKTSQAPLQIQSETENNLFRIGNSWIPYAGTTHVSQTFASNTFKFNNVSEFEWNKTYEHETQIYNTNYADYAGSRNSNLPRAYKDTQFLDDIDNFTIGSADASQLIAGRNYFTYMDLTPWSESTWTIKIKGQIWHRFPSFCYSTWCIIADATSPTLISWNWGIYWICRSR